MPWRDLDWSNVREFFVSKTWTERAGENCVRVYAVAIKGDIVIPLYTAVMEAPGMFQAGKDASETALKVFATPREETVASH